MLNPVRVAQVGNYQPVSRQKRIKSLGMAIAQIVQNPDIMAALLQQQGAMTSYVTRTTRDQNSHGTKTSLQFT
jgi:hypothetical protein